MTTTKGAEKIFFLFIMLFLACCASRPPVKVMPYVGVSLYPPTNPAVVTVLQSDPVLPHKTLGHVIIRPEGTLSLDETEKILRETAAAMGADAVVVMANMAMQAGANTWHQSGGHLITAVAIRYEDKGAAEQAYSEGGEETRGAE